MFDMCARVCRMLFMWHIGRSSQLRSAYFFWLLVLWHVSSQLRSTYFFWLLVLWHISSQLCSSRELCNSCLLCSSGNNLLSNVTTASGGSICITPSRPQ